MHLINSSLSSKVTMGFVYPALNLSGDYEQVVLVDGNLPQGLPDMVKPN